MLISSFIEVTKGNKTYHKGSNYLIPPGRGIFTLYKPGVQFRITDHADASPILIPVITVEVYTVQPKGKAIALYSDETDMSEVVDFLLAEIEDFYAQRRGNSCFCA